MKKTEIALAVVKAGIAGIPVIGGPIASLIGDFIPTATYKNIEATLEMLKEQLEKCNDRIDIDAVDKDEFAELFKSCYLTIVRTHQERKRIIAVKLIVNLLLKPGDSHKLTYTELDHFVRGVDNLSIGAINVLGNLYPISARSKHQGRREYSTNFQGIHKRMPDLSPELLMGLLEELNSMHLIHLPGAPSVRTTAYGNYPVEFTPLGQRFVDYLFELD